MVKYLTVFLLTFFFIGIFTTILKLNHIDFEIIARMIRTTRILDRAISEKLSSFDITKAQLDILFVINYSDSNSLRASEIATELFVSKANISGLLKHLIKKKYVVTFVDALDLRIQNISLTKKAKNLLKRILPEFFSVGNKALSSISQDEKQKLHSQLFHIEESLNISSCKIKEQM